MNNYTYYKQPKLNIQSALFMQAGRYIFSIFILLLLAIIFPCKALANEQTEGHASIKPFRILCISSYNYSYPTVPDQLNGLADGLNSLFVDIDYEFMDAKNYYKTADLVKFHDYLCYKINQSEPFDLVVSCDDTALHFCMSYYDELFSEVPIVFMGVNNLDDAAAFCSHDNVTGITDTLDFESNMELIKKLFPYRNHISIVVDNTSTAQGEYSELQKYLQQNDSDDNIDFTVINTSNYSENGVARAISDINQNDSLILYLSLMEDGEGNMYSLKTGTLMITNNAPDVPIWRLTLSDMGMGIFGGISISYYDIGVRAGEIATEILNGTSPKDIPLETDSGYHAYFDQEQLDKYAINTSQLPSDATIINQHTTLISFYKQNMLLMNLILLIIVLMVIIIIILSKQNRQHAKLIQQDYLTKMPNRLYIVHRLDHLMESGNPFGMIMMDVDHFKNINDTWGHLTGDEILVAVANRLKSFSKQDVIFARIGGDEFMGLVFNADKEKMDRICKETITKMKDDIPTSTENIHITISVGAAIYPTDTEKAELIQSYADAALYETKKNGRNGYRLFEPFMVENIGKTI